MRSLYADGRLGAGCVCVCVSVVLAVASFPPPLSCVFARPPFPKLPTLHGRRRRRSVYVVRVRENVGGGEHHFSFFLFRGKFDEPKEDAHKKKKPLKYELDIGIV